jgi:hypothetical protein
MPSTTSAVLYLSERSCRNSYNQICRWQALLMTRERLEVELGTIAMRVKQRQVAASRFTPLRQQNLVTEN